MARRIIIVHPREHYVKACEQELLENPSMHKVSQKKLENLFTHVFNKYKDEGRIIILPGKKDNPKEPDMSLLSKRIKLKENDLVLSDFNSESKFLDHTYPNFDKVFEHIKKEVGLKKGDKLVFGGMSSSDCVEKLALAAHKKGFKAFIDSTITELFYVNLKMMLGHNKPPAIWFEQVPIDSKKLKEKLYGKR